jgi:hypothetical protein
MLLTERNGDGWRLRHPVVSVTYQLDFMTAGM